MTAIIINTRADLDALRDSPDYLEALRVVAGSLDTAVDAAIYPEGYNEPGYSGPAVEPDWQQVETLSAIQRLGFATRAEFEAEYAAAVAADGLGV